MPVEQLAIVASAVAVQATVTRWPGPAVEQAVHALVCVPVAEYVPAAQAVQTASAVAVHVLEV